MGDPRKPRKKYSTPKHPWEKERIEREKELLKKYGLKNKKELWKVESFQRKFTDRAKRSIVATGEHMQKEKEQLLQVLQKLGIMQKTSKLDDVLEITPESFLNRRLQTIVHEKGLGRTINQARQFITHGHIAIDGKKITSPSYYVPVVSESKITFSNSSAFISPDHPEREDSTKTVKKPKKEKEIKEKKEEEVEEKKEKEEIKEEKEKEKKEIEGTGKKKKEKVEKNIGKKKEVKEEVKKEEKVEEVEKKTENETSKETKEEKE